jgi:hypothetical protein
MYDRIVPSPVTVFGGVFPGGLEGGAAGVGGFEGGVSVLVLEALVFVGVAPDFVVEEVEAVAAPPPGILKTSST